MREGDRGPSPVHAGAWNAPRLLPLLTPALEAADAGATSESPGGPSGAKWFLERALPDGHGLKEILPDCNPTLASIEVVAPDCLHVIIAQNDPAWRVLVMLGVAFERGMPRARREQLGLAAKATRETGEFDDVVTALIAPRRVARDFDRAWLNGLITFEALGERLLSVGHAADGAALREACEQQASSAWADAKTRVADFWAGYLSEARAIAPFVKLMDPPDPAGARAKFLVRGVLPEPRVRPGPLTHELSEGRVVLSLEVQDAPRLLDAMREELPIDLRAQAGGARLSLWLPAPKLSLSTPTGEQTRDVRHALACVLRLQQWLAARARNWSDWLGAASE